MVKIKNFMACIITMAMIMVGINALGYLVRPVNTDIATNTIDTFHEMPQDAFEVIGYGSSHMWRGMNPIELYNQYGIGSYNYGCNWQNINTTLLFLEDSLKTQKPKIALIETFLVGSIKRDINMDGEIYYTTAIPESKDKQEYLQECFGDNKERYLSYYMPLCAFHDNWNSITENSFQRDNTYTYDFNKTMGFAASNGVTAITIPDSENMQQAELNEDSINTLDKIVSICERNDIDIVFYTAPYQGDYLYSDAMKKYAEENNCVYFDLFEYIDEIGFDGNSDFCDKGHLNTCGSNKVADFLGDYLTENYNLTDYRSEEGNLWEKAQQ